MATNVLGPFAVRFRDNYDPDATYRQLDLVYLDGSTWLYIAEGERSGVTPGTDPLVWFKSSTSASVEDRLAAAESAQAAAQHRQGAEDAKTAAETARSGAEGARDAAAGSASEAVSSASDAAGSAAAAATSETNAAASATAAQEAADSVDGPGLMAAIEAVDGRVDTHPHDGSVEGGVKIHYSNLNGRPALTADNFLINSDFRNPVNQRGVSGLITTPGYFIDMWRSNNANHPTVEDGYIVFAAGSENEQRIEGLRLAGKIATVSVKGTTDEIVSVTGEFPLSNGTNTFIIDGWGTVDFGTNTAGKYTSIKLNPTTTKMVIAAKLEEQNISTLMYDGPMGISTELIKCCRYLYRPMHKVFGSIGTNGGNLDIHIPVPMRILPTLSTTTGILDCTAGRFTYSNAVVNTFSAGSIDMLVTPSSSITIRETIVGIMTEPFYLSSEL